MVQGRSFVIKEPEGADWQYLKPLQDWLQDDTLCAFCKRFPRSDYIDMKNPQLNYMRHTVDKCWFKPTGPLYSIKLKAEASKKRSELISKLIAAKDAAKKNGNQVDPESNKMMVQVDPESIKMTRQVVSGDGTDLPNHENFKRVNDLEVRDIVFSAESNAHWGSPECLKGRSNQETPSPEFDPISNSPIYIETQQNITEPIKITRRRRGVLYQPPGYPSPESNLDKSPVKKLIDTSSSSDSGEDNQVQPEQALMVDGYHSDSVSKSQVVFQRHERTQIADEHERTILGVTFSKTLLTFDKSQPKALDNNPILELQWPNSYWVYAAGINTHQLWEPCTDSIEDIKDNYSDAKAYLEHFTGPNEDYRSEEMIFKQNKLFLKMGIYFLNILNCEAERLVKLYPHVNQQSDLKKDLRKVRNHIYNLYKCLVDGMRKSKTWICKNKQVVKSLNEYYSTNFWLSTGERKLDVVRRDTNCGGYTIRTRFFETTKKVSFPDSLELQ